MRLYSWLCSSKIAGACLLWVVVVLIGCDTETGPEIPPLYDQEYSEEFSVSTATDSVLVMVGMPAICAAIGETRVYIDTEPSDDGFTRISLKIVGQTSGQNDRAIVAHRVLVDTLQVWCGLNATTSWEEGPAGEKTSPIQPWLMPERVDIAVPEHVDVRFLGYWYE